jgi:hypothetical protein
MCEQLSRTTARYNRKRLQRKCWKRSTNQLKGDIPHMTETLELFKKTAVKDLLDLEGRLEELEAIIENGLPQFIEVGLALLEIRERELFSLSHRTWTGYLEERWSMSDSRARQLMNAAKESVTDVTVLEDGTMVLGDGEPIPKTEGEARRRSRERRQKDESETAEHPPATDAWFEATRKTQAATRTLIRSSEVETLPLEVISTMSGRIIDLNRVFSELEALN